MAALTAGKKAPMFEARTIDKKPFSLPDELAKRPVVLAFFKVSCPVCQYAFPFLERLHKVYGDQNVTLFGVSQDDAKATSRFMKEFGVTFPVVLDDPGRYVASNAYGLTNVPTVFWIGQDGGIEVSSVGWVKKDFDEIGRKMADAGKVAPIPVFQGGDDVRDFRAG